MTNLQMIFGKFKAVENMTMTVNKGDIVALLGHNGAGKTTTINMLTGMIHPTSGEALINGKSIEKDVQEARRDLGLCQ
jgi:ABC-type multidrug transport system ATPase subunit